VLAFVVNITVLLNLKARAEENFGTYFHEREKLSEEAAYFKAEAGIKDNDNVLVVGNGCHYYLLTDTYSKSKYPYCPPATFDNEKNSSEYIDEIKKEYPKMIIVDDIYKRVVKNKVDGIDAVLAENYEKIGRLRNDHIGWANADFWVLKKRL